MADRPEYIASEQLSGPGFSRSIPMPIPNRSGEILGEGIERIGKQIQSAAASIQEAQLRKRHAQADTDAMMMFTSQARKADQVIEGLKIDADHDTYAKNVLGSLDAFGNEGLDNLKDPLAKAAFQKRYSEYHLHQYGQALKWETQLFHKYQEGALASYFNDAMHRAASESQADGYKTIGMAVQDAYDMMATNPELADTIEKATLQFVKNATGRMMRQDASRDPEGFADHGPEKWEDKTIAFQDKKGVSHTLTIGPDPALTNSLHDRALKQATAAANKRMTLKNAMEKDMEHQVNLAMESWEDDMWSLLRTQPDKGLPADFEGRAAVAIHHLGVERVQKLRDALISGSVEGKDAPGQRANAEFALSTGRLDQDGIVGWPGISNKTRADLMKELKRFRKEDDIVHLPAYKVNLDRVIGAIGGADPAFIKAMAPPQPEVAEASFEFFRRSHQPGVTEHDLDKLAVEIIQRWKPGMKIHPPTPRVKGDETTPKPQSQLKSDILGHPATPGQADLPRSPRKGEVATDASGNDYRWNGSKWDHIEIKVK